MTRKQNRKCLRAAFTLVELLIVMGIATLVASLSLSTVRGLLKDQKITQAARMAKQYIDTARTRAMANGRPVALFLERAASGDGSGNPTEANYTVTRMSIGEVFPPYTGDVSGATATLVDSTVSPLRPAGDGFADVAIFTAAEVVSGFGTGTAQGMLSVGDTIEFVGNSQRFLIEAIGPGPAAGQVAVTFFNPPASYDRDRALELRKTTPMLDSTFEQAYSGREPTLRSGTAAAFRAYRKPSKSLVGTITMPRGTCIDLSVSGIGPTSAANELNSPFYLGSSPDSVASGRTIQPSTFSRIAIVFNAEGRATGILRDDKIVSTNSSGVTDVRPTGFQFRTSLSSALHLMVGRTDQVLPSAPLSAPAEAGKDDPRGNLRDGSNTWISIHPFTGAIESSPVAEVSPATVSAGSLAQAVLEARAFAIRGVNDGGR